MKFHDLAVGQRFELGGAVYVKTSPVLASKEEGTEKKFMARSAPVLPLDGVQRPAAAKTGKALPAEAVLAAFEAYHARCRTVLELEVSAERRQQIADVLERGRQDFIDSISKPD
ncbi:MAG: hypothetical protein PHX38_10855 [Sulfuricella sp.]|nr:hypothetical protein [Sulfuricella sp.]